MRLDRAQLVMSREEINSILLFDPFNIRYLTGYKPAGILGSSVAVLIRGKDPLLIVPQGECDFAQAESWFRNVQSYQPQTSDINPSPLLKSIQTSIKEHDLRSVDIGIELDFISARRFEEIKRLLPDAGFKNISTSMTELRMIKDEAELEKIKTAFQIAENGLRAAIEFVRPGISEIEVAAEVERTLRKAGATQTGYPTVIASGPRAGCPFVPASRREIGKAEFVVISISAVNNDYCSNLTRSILTGKPTKKQRAIFECARDSVTTAKNTLTPETLIRDIALCIRRIADDRGYLPYLHSQLGSGVGLQPLEPPHISPIEETPLIPGMVFTIEAGITIPKAESVRVGDTIICKKEGDFETLNQIPLETV
ncbi:MAG: M24 family metallopeptidase [Candidatus Thorarchaeota archaeon]